MEKITIFLFLFICFFLFYSYLKLKNEKPKKQEKEKNISCVLEPKENLENHIIAAVVATVMTGKKYKIKNIFLEKKENKKSSWKIAGINHNMQRRERI